ncbi:E4 SUMO-protein ligase PIAL2 [Citrus sinensis]|uniref:E4 SUMO-protein ligase PIAL2 n=1 Tax=Citrus sinensis TaxID=2711 RepID=A0ACB8LP86_CITSI|nr:E4 SUMO-protein ligase PIAL2 [Citrus sinensis]
MGAVQQQLLQQLKASAANSQRVELAAQRLAAYVLLPDHQNVREFFSLCLALSRGIDYAVANNEVPPKAQELPSLLKQICQRKNDPVLQAAIMVLMFSVKSACRIEWFSVEEAQELIALADEIGSGFLGPSINGNLVSTVSTIMTRFYPLLKMGQILASLEVEVVYNDMAAYLFYYLGGMENHQGDYLFEVQWVIMFLPGYGAFMIDFHISKNMIQSTEEKIRLFVAQTDKTETSACVISPQHVNFILNGKGIERRTNVFMDPGPQLPTNVSPMLKYGTNLLQAVGQFNGHYIIIVAVMSTASSLESSKLQDYVQSGITMQDSDSDLIEGPSRISLNCPISYKRINTPVKGHSCRHHQVLREVGENVADVIISADGSWKAIMEADDNVDQAHDRILSSEKEGCEHQESAAVANSNPVILDLTKNDDEIDAMSTGEIEDVKPDLHSQPVSTNLTMPSELISTVQADQNFVTTDDDFWAGILYPDGSASSDARSDAQTVGGVSAPSSTSFMVSPVLTDAISPAFNREVDALGYTHLTTPVMQSLCSAPNNLQIQQTQLMNPSVNYEYGRSAVARHLNRTPMAVQALPAASHGFSDMEQQQRISRSHMNTVLGSDIASSPLQHQSAAQAVGLQASSALSGAYRVSSGLSTNNHNLHQQHQALNPRMPPLMSQSPSAAQSSSPYSLTPQQGSVQVGSGHPAINESRQHARLMAVAQRPLSRPQMTRQPPTVPVQVQTPSAGPRYPTTSVGVRGSVGDQRENVAGSMQSVMIDNPTDFPLEQNWRPTGRMRGSLSGRAYSDALSHMMILPTQPVAQPARPQLSPPPHLSVPNQLQALLGNSNTRFPQLQTNPVTDPGSRGSGTRPERSHGMH